MIIIIIIVVLFSHLIFGDPLVDKSSFPSPLLGLTESTAASPRSNLDGIGGGPGFFAGMGGWAFEEAIER